MVYFYPKPNTDEVPYVHVMFLWSLQMTISQPFAEWFFTRIDQAITFQICFQKLFWSFRSGPKIRAKFFDGFLIIFIVT